MLKVCDRTIYRTLISGKYLARHKRTSLYNAVFSCPTEHLTDAKKIATPLFFPQPSGASAQACRYAKKYPGALMPVVDTCLLNHYPKSKSNYIKVSVILI